MSRIPRDLNELSERLVGLPNETIQQIGAQLYDQAGRPRPIPPVTDRGLTRAMRANLLVGQRPKRTWS